MKVVFSLLIVFAVGSLAFASTGFAGTDCATCTKTESVGSSADDGYYICPTTGEKKMKPTSESHAETCPIATALADTELSEHGQAVLTLGKAGKPVWIKEAGFGLIDAEVVECPVHFATHMTHYVASQGAEGGCAKCQAVIDTAPEKEGDDNSDDTQAAK